MKISLFRMLMLTAWCCVALFVMRLHGCTTDVITQEIQDSLYTPEESKSWWDGFHKEGGKEPNILDQPTEWRAFFNGKSTRSALEAGSVVLVLLGLGFALCVPAPPVCKRE